MNKREREPTVDIRVSRHAYKDIQYARIINNIHTYTLNGSDGSDVNVTLNVTFALLIPFIDFYSSPSLRLPTKWKYVFLSGARSPQARLAAHHRSLQLPAALAPVVSIPGFIPNLGDMVHY